MLFSNGLHIGNINYHGHESKPNPSPGPAINGSDDQAQPAVWARPGLSNHPRPVQCSSQHRCGVPLKRNTLFLPIFPVHKWVLLRKCNTLSQNMTVRKLQWPSSFFFFFILDVLRRRIKAKNDWQRAWSARFNHYFAATFYALATVFPHSEAAR